MTPVADRLTVGDLAQVDFDATEPGVQIYDGRDGKCPSRGLYAAIAIETQGWSDAPSYPAFPPITLRPDAPARQITEWRFDRV